MCIWSFNTDFSIFLHNLILSLSWWLLNLSNIVFVIFSAFTASSFLSLAFHPLLVIILLRVCFVGRRECTLWLSSLFIISFVVIIVGEFVLGIQNRAVSFLFIFTCAPLLTSLLPSLTVIFSFIYLLSSSLLLQVNVRVSVYFFTCCSSVTINTTTTITVTSTTTITTATSLQPSANQFFHLLHALIYNFTPGHRLIHSFIVSFPNLLPHLLGTSLSVHLPPLYTLLSTLLLFSCSCCQNLLNFFLLMAITPAYSSACYPTSSPPASAPIYSTSCFSLLLPTPGPPSPLQLPPMSFRAPASTA